MGGNLVRGIAHFLGLLCVIVMGFVLSFKSFAMSCATSLGHLRALQQMQGPHALDVRMHLTIREMAELRHAFQDHTGAVLKDFKKLLLINDLGISRYNEEGVPVLTSRLHPNMPGSQSVLATLVINRVGFEPPPVKKPIIAFDELIKAFEDPRSIEQMQFKSLGNGYTLFVELNDYGLIIGMRRDSDGKVVMAAVPEGGEAHSPHVMTHIFEDLLHIKN